MNKTTTPKIPLTPERELIFNDTKVFKIIVYSKLIVFVVGYIIGYLYAYVCLNYLGHSELEVAANLSTINKILILPVLIFFIYLGIADTYRLDEIKAKYTPHCLVILIPPLYILLRQSRNDLGLKYFWIYLAIAFITIFLERVIS